jgi:hypothetical protein
VRTRAFVFFLFFLCSVVVAVCIATCGCGAGFSLFTQTARCVDGAYTDSTNCSGACSGHGGVDVWFTSDCGGIGKAKAIAKGRGDGR